MELLADVVCQSLSSWLEAFILVLPPQRFQL